MNRSLWIAAGAILTIFTVPLLTVGQKAANTTGQSVPAPTQGHSANPLNASADFCQCVGAGDSASVARIEQKLRGKLQSPGLEFSDTALQDVAAYIQESYGIPVQLDTAALHEEGIDPQEPVTASLHGISLRSALRLMLKQIGLTYMIEDDVLIITSPAEAEAHLVTCVYDVRDLPRAARSGIDFDPLIDTIISCISPETWVENGGNADIRPLQPGFLVVSQTAEVHEEIAEFLNAVRELKIRPVAAAAYADPNASLDELVTEWNVQQ